MGLVLSNGDHLDGFFGAIIHHHFRRDKEGGQGG
jgi:hypothetical protein